MEENFVSIEVPRREDKYIIKDYEDTRVHKPVKISEVTRSSNLVSAKILTVSEVRLTKNGRPYYLLESELITPDHRRQQFNLALSLGWITDSVQSTRALSTSFIVLPEFVFTAEIISHKHAHWPERGTPLYCFDKNGGFLCELQWDPWWYQKNTSYDHMALCEESELFD